LLIGEIDLSVGYVSGIASVAVAEFQMAGSSHDFPGLVAIGLAILVGAAIGAVQGSIIAFLGVPSFVVTLAGLLIVQGMIINILGTEGVIGIDDKQILDVSNYVLTKNTGWIVAIVFTALLALASFGTYVGRLRAGLPTGNLIVTIIRVLFYGGLAFAAVAVCNHSRGVPLVGLVVVFVVVLFAYIAGRTTFGLQSNRSKSTGPAATAPGVASRRTLTARPTSAGASGTSQALPSRSRSSSRTSVRSTSRPKSAGRRRPASGHEAVSSPAAAGRTRMPRPSSISPPAVSPTRGAMAA
jgi:D-xylose transport system permease protein